MVSEAGRRDGAPQDDLIATRERTDKTSVFFAGIGATAGPKPWRISFSYGRALQDHAPQALQGRDENLDAGRQILYHRARCNSPASLGRYADEMEGDTGGRGTSAAPP